MNARAAGRGERVIERVLAACSLVSIAVTIGIIVVLAVEAGDFFRHVSPAAFFGDTQWTPRFADNRHFGVWPLSQAAEACFGTSTWPAQVAVPQMSLEFELADPRAVADGADELRARGYQLLHDAKKEPWGQTVARLLSPEGVVVGLSYTPSLHQ